MDEFRTAYFDVQTRGLDWWKPVWSEKEENREEWFVENSPGVRGCVALTPLQGLISFIFVGLWAYVGLIGQDLPNPRIQLPGPSRLGVRSITISG